MLIDFVDIVRAESERFAFALDAAGSGAAVPCCPDWDAADLAWHLTEVQYFWGGIVNALAQDPDEVERAERPATVPIRPLFRDAAARLVAALGERNPEDGCWTWSGVNTVAWVRRRQAHEALIHRVDAEQAAGGPLTPVDPAVASDGVDEILNVMIAGIPEWGEFTADGTSMRIECTDAGGSWDLVFGRFTGTSPNTGTTYDTDALMVEPTETPDAVLRGTAWDLDLWLWGRGPLAPITITGDRSFAERLRTMAAENTQ